MRLKVHQRIFVSMLVIAVFVVAYVGNNLVTIAKLNDKFQIVTQQAVPLNKVSTELLSGQADYVQLLQAIDRKLSTSALKESEHLLATQAGTIQESIKNLQLLSAGFTELSSVIPELKQDFASLEQTGQGLLKLKQSNLVLSERLPKQFSELQAAISDMKQNLVYVSEESDDDISTETYHVVDNGTKISAIITRIYFSGTDEVVQSALPQLKSQMAVISKIFSTFEAEDEYDSDEWDMALEAYQQVNAHLAQPNKMLDSLTQLALVNKQYAGLLAKTELESIAFANQIKSLNQATQTILTNASTLFGNTLSNNRFVSFILSVIVFGVIIVIGYKLQRRIKEPLVAFKGYVSQLESGDLTHTLTLNSGDEFEDTASKMNQLTARLNKVMCDVSVQANDAESTADYVVEASKELSSVLSEQIEQVTEINQFMATLKAASDQVADNVNRTYTQIDDVSGFTSQATKASHSSSETVGGLMKLLTQTIDSVEQLAKDIHEIHDMTDLISNIADQTNLLALNAAIEAARAGQHGRGFAVVADEVRSLATSTQETTEIIRTRIEQIVVQSNTSKQDVDQCYVIAEEVHERFLSNGEIMEKIDKATDEVSDFTAQVSQAAGQQAQYITSCEKSLKKINALAELNSATFGGISTIMLRLVELTGKLRTDADYFEYQNKQQSKSV